MSGAADGDGDIELAMSGIEGTNSDAAAIAE
jgi:hypothetical protein